ARQAAFLLNSGSVVGLDGSSLPQFSNSITQQLFVVIWHRNHIGVMSANPLTETEGVFSYNFSISESQAYHGPDGHKQIGTGLWGMFSGDGNANGDIDLNDKTNVWAPQAGSSGYTQGDYDMNAEVNNTDKNDYWLPNNGKGSQVPE
ncbi:MAG: hypothetical protein K8R68_03370, partial [Bacteroidales bacterium]|nr:hypothetical protein [Bacteroidales bacterium]